VAGAVYLEPSVNALVFSREGTNFAGRLAYPPSVDEFQKTVLDFVRACSEKLSPELFRILLEGVLLQPRSIAARLGTRSQNPDRLLQEARAGNLPILVVTGGRDGLLNPEGLKDFIQGVGWQKFTYSHLENADHMPWVSDPEAFRDTVLGWVKGNPAAALHKSRQPARRRE
jgi:pimeloyl-ACP methyl ester carboxylesterase